MRTKIHETSDNGRYVAVEKINWMGELEKTEYFVPINGGYVRINTRNFPRCVKD